MKNNSPNNRDKSWLTPSEVTALLATAALWFPALIPLLVVQLFAGLRLYEALRLTWDYVLLDSGIIWVVDAKSGQRRGVPITPNLEAWLVRYHRADGPLYEGSQNGLHTSLQKVFARAGIEKVAHQLRSSFLVYHLSRSSNWHQTASEAGTIDLHLGSFVVNSVSRDVAEEYWNILPASDPDAEPSE